MVRRILVVGGTSETGQAVVKRLAGRGDKVVFNGRNQAVGEALAKETGATFLALDYTDYGAPERIVGQSANAMHGMDGLVLAGGLLHVARISETTDAAWDKVLSNNLIAPWRIARAAMFAMSVDGGAIVAIASGAAARTEFELGAYSVAKRALLWMTNMIAVEGGPMGIVANSICPGDMPGGMSAIVDEEQMRDLGDPFIPPVGHLTKPEDIARSVEFLLGEPGTSVTGTSLTVDGGLRSALRAFKVQMG